MPQLWQKWLRMSAHTARLDRMSFQGILSAADCMYGSKSCQRQLQAAWALHHANKLQQYFTAVQTASHCLWHGSLLHKLTCSLG